MSENENLSNQPQGKKEIEERRSQVFLRKTGKLSKGEVKPLGVHSFEKAYFADVEFIDGNSSAVLDKS